MSRAYRISVAETLRRHIHVDDGVKTTLELLQVLPPERMAGLLADELAKLGFEPADDGKMRREDDDGVEVTVDTKEGSVTVRLAAEKNLELTDKRSVLTERESSSAKKQLQQRAREALEQKAERETEKLRQEVTETLERKLKDLHQELDGVVSRVTREALKEKAQQMGEIQEISEDEETGSMTIRVRL
jgi:hypothetical protein